MIFFTADLHLGHANIIKHCDRPFTTADEMDERLILNWNAHVRPTDTVYIIGDMIFRSARGLLGAVAGQEAPYSWKPRQGLD